MLRVSPPPACVAVAPPACAACAACAASPSGMVLIGVPDAARGAESCFLGSDLGGPQDTEWQSDTEFGAGEGTWIPERFTNAL